LNALLEYLQCLLKSIELHIYNALQWSSKIKPRNLLILKLYLATIIYPFIIVCMQRVLRKYKIIQIWWKWQKPPIALALLNWLSVSWLIIFAETCQFHSSILNNFSINALMRDLPLIQSTNTEIHSVVDTASMAYLGISLHVSYWRGLVPHQPPRSRYSNRAVTVNWEVYN